MRNLVEVLEAYGEEKQELAAEARERLKELEG